jgi:hypothetical protein
MNTQVSKSLITLVAALFIILSFWGWVDKVGENYTEQGLKRALITYGVARGLNGVISVAQGTEVAIEPFGVGLTLAPGQILDPVNDLIERFSWVVLASGASLGIQRVMIQITSWLWFSLFVSALIIAAVFMMWRNNLSEEVEAKEWFKNSLYRLAIIFLIIRFAIPVIAIVNEGLYIVFLSPQYEEAKQNLQQTSDKLEQINTEQQQQARDASFVEKMQQQYQSAVSAMDVDKRLEQLKVTIAEVSESALNMIVVFVMQTLIFPLLFLWLTMKLIKSVFTF